MAPYQIFFPIGLLGALWAVGVWFVPTAVLGSPAMFIHGKLIAGVFLWSYIVGFLMTAVPRMTGTPAARIWEYVVGLSITAVLFVTAWMLDPVPFYSAVIAQVLFLAVFAGRRLWLAVKVPPVFFSHVGLAFGLALGGAFAHAKGESYLGLHLYHVGTVLLLVLGIGTRFFAFLSGLPSDFETNAPSWARRGFHALGALTALLLICAGWGFASAYLGLAVVGLVYLFGIWRIQRPATRPSALKWAMRVVAAVIPLTFFLAWSWPELALAWLHLLFIAGFALITLAVSTRVTLAHGSYPTEIETRAPALWGMFVLLAFSALMRVGYGLVDPPFKTMFLHGGGVLWFLALGSWSVSFLPKIFIPGPQQKPSC
ncbi:MAG: NnrS family protein [Bdellovibrionaceae bacterium]|nr:NnrS family protein [Pseudobdellovibrionaceae bacterium]